MFGIDPAATNSLKLLPFEEYTCPWSHLIVNTVLRYRRKTFLLSTENIGKNEILPQLT